MKIRIFLAFLFTLSLILNVACGGSDATNIDKTTSNILIPKVGNRPTQTAPDFQLQDLDGNTVSLSDYRGSPVIVHFWRIN